MPMEGLTSDSVVGNPDGDIVRTYIPLNSDYEPNYQNSDLDLNKTPLINLPTVGPGYPQNIDNLGSIKIDGRFGSRCNFFQSQILENIFSELPNMPLADRLRFYAMVGMSDAADYENQCGPNGEDCRCDPGLECTLNSKLNKLISMTNDPNNNSEGFYMSAFTNVEFQNRAGRVCLYKDTCANPTVELSPFQACYNDKYNSCISAANGDGTVTQEERDNCENTANIDCNGYDTQCSYTDLCKKITPSQLEYAEGLSGSGQVPCDDHSECSSGYCRTFTNSEIDFFFPNNPPPFNKMCIGSAECRPPCTPEGEYLDDPTQNYCCMEAIELRDDATGNIKCASPSEIVTFALLFLKLNLVKLTVVGSFTKIPM